CAPQRRTPHPHRFAGAGSLGSKPGTGTGFVGSDVRFARRRGVRSAAACAFSEASLRVGSPRCSRSLRPAFHSKGDPRMATARVREILSWYAGENPGVLSNLARMMNTGKLAGTGRMVILPVDQGFEHGPARTFAPNPPAYDPRYHFQLAIEAGCNAYAAPLGFMEAGVADFCGEVPLILKCNNHDVLNDEKDPISAVTAGVSDALRLGCVAVGFTIYPASAERTEMYQQLRELSEEAKAAGLAVVVWSYPRG